jgi:hypothetical protein
MQTHEQEEEDLSEETASKTEELRATLLAKVGEREAQLVRKLFWLSI